MELLGYYTTRGSALSAKLHAGTALQVTRVTAGDGETPLTALSLTCDCQTLAANSPRRSGTAVTLPVTLMAAQAETSYTLREVGVYAQDPDLGEILYRLYRLDEPVGIQAGGQLVIRLDLQETVSEAASVTVAGTAAGLLTESCMGIPGGLATLDAGGNVPVDQLPYTYGTEDIEAGSASSAATGTLHFVYE